MWCYYCVFVVVVCSLITQTNRFSDCKKLLYIVVHLVIFVISRYSNALMQWLNTHGFKLSNPNKQQFREWVNLFGALAMIPLGNFDPAMTIVEE